MSEWVEPNPSREQVKFWDYTDVFSGVPIAWWPHPNTVRINCRYRFIETNPSMVPLASRYALYFRPSALPYSEDPQERFGFWWGDLLVKGDNHIGVTTPENKDGYTLDIDVKHHVSLPHLGEPGIEFKVTWHKVGLNSNTYSEEYPTSHSANLWRHNMNTNNFRQNGQWFWDLGDPPAMEQFTAHLFAVTECFEFPFLPPGFAQFNGVNSYIKLLNVMNFASSPFRLSCEFRPRTTVNHLPFMGRDGMPGFFGMLDSRILFGNLTLTTSWTPIQDVWLPWVYEFEPSTQLQHKLTIDGNVVRDATNSRQFTQFDTLGVYKQGIPGTLWADMDMRNLKIESGTPGNYTTLLDMPLIENALDLGPLSNHGTTFNMPLPSV